MFEDDITLSCPERENIGDDIFTPRKVSKERLKMKYDHATRFPDGRTAELMGHIYLLETEISILKEALRYSTDERLTFWNEEAIWCNECGWQKDDGKEHSMKCYVAKNMKLLEYELIESEQKGD